MGALCRRPAVSRASYGRTERDLMTESTAFGDRFGERLRCERAPAFVSRSLRNTTIAVTEIKSDNPVPGLSSSLTREDAFLVALQLRDYPVHE